MKIASAYRATHQMSAKQNSGDLESVFRVEFISYYLMENTMIDYEQRPAKSYDSTWRF